MLDQTTINNWLAKVSSTDVRIWVENPETIKVSGLMGKSYTTFRVLLKASDGELVGIRHRYSEFETLRNTLKVIGYDAVKHLSWLHPLIVL